MLDRYAPDYLASISNDVQASRGEIAEVRRMLILQSRSVTWLAEQSGRAPFPKPPRMPLVSVIMPTWDRGDVIERAIESVREQSYQHWECLIVDDGSTDDTRERIEPYLGDARFHYLRRHPFLSSGSV